MSTLASSSLIGTGERETRRVTFVPSRRHSPLKSYFDVLSATMPRMWRLMQSRWMLLIVLGHLFLKDLPVPVLAEGWWRDLRVVLNSLS